MIIKETFEGYNLSNNQLPEIVAVKTNVTAEYPVSSSKNITMGVLVTWLNPGASPPEVEAMKDNEPWNTSQWVISYAMY